VGAENSVSPGCQPIRGEAVAVLTPPRRRLVTPPASPASCGTPRLVRRG
jgi:hypothetical protein